MDASEKAKKKMLTAPHAQKEKIIGSLPAADV